MNIGHYIVLLTGFMKHRKLSVLILLLVLASSLVLVSINHSGYMHDVSFRSMSALTFGFYDGFVNEVFQSFSKIS